MLLPNRYVYDLLAVIYMSAAVLLDTSIALYVLYYQNLFCSKPNWIK